MTSSTSESYLHPDQLAKLKMLLAADDLQVLAKKGGGNSKVFCIQAQGKKWAIKSYPPYAPGQRDRLAAEATVYQFLNKQNIPAVPLLKTSCSDQRWLIIDWIEGEIPCTYTADDINQAIQFIQNISRLNQLPLAKELPLAAEACLSLTVLLNQIQRRLERLQAATSNEPQLDHFLQQRFIPLFVYCRHKALKEYAAHQLDPDKELLEECRSLIPADFGFHNTLKSDSGELTFFDFDYFGWDDPVKLLADILWHPKMKLSAEQQQLFIQGFKDIYQHDTHFLSRFYSTWPLFGLRWVLILLNEFIPAFWQNRQHAEAYHDQVAAKKEQLQRAEQLLNVITLDVQYEPISATCI